MERVYVEGWDCQDGHVRCGLPTAIVGFLSSYLNSSRLCVHLVRHEPAGASLCVHIPDLCREKVEVAAVLQGCSLPATVADGDYLARAGLCSVLRHMVKVAAAAEGATRHTRLLGHKGVCLKACAEVSAWTKFCECDLPFAIATTLQSQSVSRCTTERELPPELCKLEHHLGEPAIIANIGKRRQEALKKLKKSDLAGKLEELRLHDASSQQLPELQHRYAEGAELTLTDLVLFPPITCYLNFHRESVPTFEKELPRVMQWYRRMLREAGIQAAAERCGIPVLRLEQLDSPNGRTVTATASTVVSNFQTLRDVSKKKSKTNTNCVLAVMEKLKANGVNASAGQHPCGDDVQLAWETLPVALNPREGDVPPARVKRKCQQLENLVSAVCHLAQPGHVIVDFCSGGGHLGIVLAHFLPQCKVILVENKEESIVRSRERIRTLGLTNITLYQCNLDYFVGQFDIGVCLHACGVASDLVLQCCLDNKASFVICPCCYGGIQNTHTVHYPRSGKFRDLGISSEECILLGHAADQTQVTIPQAQTGKACMILVDTDRASLAQEHGYQVTVCTLQPPTCSPKNNLLIGRKSADG